MKCKKQVEAINEEMVEFNTKKGIKKAIRGNCPECNTRVFKFVGK